MPVIINGTTGIDKVQDGVIVQADLASGVAGNGPAFSAYPSANQNVNTATWTKVAVDTEEFDTASCFNVSLYRFTPNVAGYYQINGASQFATTVDTAITRVAIYKNGSVIKYGAQVHASTAKVISSVVSALVYLNGTSDYVEMYAYQDTGVVQGVNGINSDSTYFQGFLARAA